MSYISKIFFFSLAYDVNHSKFFMLSPKKHQAVEGGVCPPEDKDKGLGLRDKQCCLPVSGQGLMSTQEQEGAGLPWNILGDGQQPSNGSRPCTQDAGSGHRCAQT